MSLLDDVSIVVTPNGYKAGELYAVIPVPTEGAELVTNGDFATDSDWTKGTGWSIANGKATSIGSNFGQQLKQTILQTNKIYKLSFDIVDYTSGNIALESVYYGVTQTFNGIGSYVAYFTSLSQTEFRLYSQNFNGSIDNVSVKEYTSADMDVTRATAATRVDEDGLVNYAEIVGGELLNCNSFNCADPAALWSEGSGWSFSGGKAIYDGTGGTSPLAQSDVIEVGKTYRVSIEVLSNEGTGANTIFLGGTVLSAVNLSVGTHVFYGATNNTSVILTIYGRSGEVFEIGSVSVKEAARDNVPRIDYTGGGCPHILAEPQRTNTLSYSEDFEASGWGVYNSTLETDAVISPNGILNATKLIGTNDVTAHTLYTTAYTVVASADYTHSVFIKKSQSKYVQLYTGSGFGNYYANFNLEDGIVETFTTLDANIENIGDGWYKCSTKANSSTTTAQSTVALIDSATSGRGYAFNAEDESVYMWGAQIEQGSYATSYIPTSGSTVTRNQDIFTRDGIGSLINSTEGVLFVEMAALHTPNTNTEYLTISDGTYINNSIMVQLRSRANQFAVWAYSGGVTQVAEIITLTDITDFNKIAIKWKANDFEVFVNGSSVYSTSTYTAPTGLDRLEFSRNGTAHFDGKVKQLQVYKTALTDEQLLQLTGESGTDFYESYAEMAAALTYTLQ